MADESFGGLSTSDSSSQDSGEQESQTSAPYESLLSAIVAKIRNEPFLFVIAIAALIISAVMLAARLSSADLRFVIVVIAALAIVVIAGYYVREGVRMAAQKRTVADKTDPLPVSLQQQNVEATGGAQIDGALQETFGTTAQTISASGPGTVIKDVVQSSTSGQSGDVE
jgi:hypothetical protein